MKNPYETLGVDKGETKEGIKRAYKNKARSSHPDAGGSTEQMAEVNEAYRVLSDDRKRKAYDNGEEINEIGIQERIAARVCQITEQMIANENETPVVFLKRLKESVYAQLDNEQREIENSRRKLKRFKSKIVKATEPDLVTMYVNKREEHFNEQEAALKEERGVADGTFVLLDRYVFKEDEKMTRYSTNATFTGTLFAGY